MNTSHYHDYVGLTRNRSKPRDGPLLDAKRGDDEKQIFPNPSEQLPQVTSQTMVFGGHWTPTSKLYRLCQSLEAYFKSSYNSLPPPPSSSSQTFSADELLLSSIRMVYLGRCSSRILSLARGRDDILPSELKMDAVERRHAWYLFN